MIRVDASIQIGTGHVMRCLTLAEALRDKNIQVEFICRKHEGNLISLIHDKGFMVHALPVMFDTDKHNQKKDQQLQHTDWLGATQWHDAQACKNIVSKTRPDWLIVDHYAIDKNWEAELQHSCHKIMVIDDLADRQHLCDLLLDQTYGCIPSDYRVLVPENCELLLGSHFALLRPDFAQWREYSLRRREKPVFKKLLITMGA